MNTIWKAAVAAVLVVGAAQAGHAQETVEVVSDGAETLGHNGLTISGAVGMPLNPTANIPNSGGVRVQANYFDLGDEPDFDTEFRLYGIYGATRLGDSKLEISGGLEKFRASSDIDDFEDALDGTGVALGAKYQFYRNEEGNTFGAAGVGYSHALYKNMHACVVGTRAFNAGSRVVFGHLGLRYDRFEIDDDIDESSSKASIYAGAELPIDRRGRFNLVGELQSKNAGDDLGGKAPYSLSVRYQTPRGLAASIGIARQGVFADHFNDNDGDSSGLFAQVGYSF